MKIIVTGSDQSTLTTLRPDREEVRSTFIDTAEQYGGRDQYMSPGDSGGLYEPHRPWLPETGGHSI